MKRSSDERRESDDQSLNRELVSDTRKNLRRGGRGAKRVAA